MTLPVALTTEVQKLAPSASIELFVLDATNQGGGLLYFHAGTNQLRQNVVWQGITYVRYPIRASGFDMNGQGLLPRPQLQVSNILSAITTLLLNYSDLIGAKVTRKRTLAKFLDAVNFTGGVNPTADPTAEFQDDVYFVDRKASEDRDQVTFELAAAIDVAGVQLPRRQVIQNVCIWKYRGAECGFTGAPLFDDQDAVLTNATSVPGQALLAARAAMLAAKTAYDAAVVALTNAAYAQGSACDLALSDTTGGLVAYWSGAYNPNSFTGGSKYGVFTYVKDGVTIYSHAFYNGTEVSLGSTYRQGALEQQLTDNSNGMPEGVVVSFYTIERWLIGAGCTAATTAYNTAVTNRDTALATYNASVTTYNAAVAALPVNDPLYSAEKCGKRLSSCKARFGDTAPLPFGSFPGAGLVQ